MGNQRVKGGKRGAPYGARNAERWTENKIINKLDNAITLLLEDEKSNTNEDNGVPMYKILSIQQLAAIQKLYPDWYLFKTKRFPDNEEMQEKWKRVKNIIHARLIERTMLGTVNPTVGMFLLKSNFDMVEKQHIINDNTNKHDGEVNVNINYAKKEEKNDNKEETNE